jgi:hypothetical protein
MHPDEGSNRHPPDVVSHTRTEHFGQATGAITEPTTSAQEIHKSYFAARLVHQIAPNEKPPFDARCIMTLGACLSSIAASIRLRLTSILGFAMQVQRISDGGHFVLLEQFPCHRSP